MAFRHYLGQTSPPAPKPPVPNAGRAMGNLFGLAPSGVYHAAAVTSSAVCLTASTLTCIRERIIGGLLSAALAVGFRPQALPGTYPVEPDFPLH